MTASVDWGKFPLEGRLRVDVQISYFSAQASLATTDELEEWFDLSFEQHPAARKALLRNLMRRADAEDALNAIRRLVSQVENVAVPTRRHGVADTTLYKLGSALPEEEKRACGIRCLQHRRKTRRYAGLRLLNELADPLLGGIALQSWFAYRDADCLQAAIRWNAKITAHPTEVMSALPDDDYWHARYLAALPDDDALAFVSSHPLAFVRMVGRSQRHELRYAVVKLMEFALAKIRSAPQDSIVDPGYAIESSHDAVQLFKMGFWALSKLGERGEMEKFARLLDVSEK